MCSVIRFGSGGSPHDRSGASGPIPGPMVTVWMQEGLLHQSSIDRQSIMDRPEGSSLRVFYSKEARA
jgi:hypothetical protein